MAAGDCQHTLLYHHYNDSLWDISMSPDASVLFTSYARTSAAYPAEIHALSQQGSEATTNLPGTLRAPRAIGTSRDGDSVVVVDQGDAGKVIVLFDKVDGSWARSEFSIKQAKAVAVASNKEIIVGNNEYITRFSHGGAVVWKTSVPIPGCSKLFLAVDTMDNVVVSDENAKLVYVIDKTGEICSKFPRGSIKRPQGVCCTSDGSVMVADGHSGIVSKYTRNGEFIQKVIETDKIPIQIDMTQDRYLTVGSVDGIYTYQLQE